MQLKNICLAPENSDKFRDCSELLITQTRTRMSLQDNIDFDYKIYYPCYSCPFAPHATLTHNINKHIKIVALFPVPHRISKLNRTQGRDRSICRMEITFWKCIRKGVSCICRGNLTAFSSVYSSVPCKDYSSCYFVLWAVSFLVVLMVSLLV